MLQIIFKIAIPFMNYETFIRVMSLHITMFKLFLHITLNFNIHLNDLISMNSIKANASNFKSKLNLFNWSGIEDE